MSNAESRHRAIWAAIEIIAKRQGLSASGLAKLAGFDSTAFNPSKRIKGDNLRWPSCETVSGILTVAGMTWAEFGRLVDDAGKEKPRTTAGL